MIRLVQRGRSLSLSESLPTAAKVRELFDYDPSTGILTWRCRGGAGAHIHQPGDIAGSLDGRGYYQLNALGKVHRLHRIIWLWMTGEWPKSQIDHRDTIRSNNCWDNLRLATGMQNNGNANIPSHNTSGTKGVAFHKQRKKWRASITKDNRAFHLGLFETREEATIAYRTAADEYFGEFARAV